MTPRPFGPIKPDGRRYTQGVHANGGKQLIVRALREVPEIKVVRDQGYVLVDLRNLPREGQVTLSRGNAKDSTVHFRGPAGLFSEDWRTDR